MSLKKCGLFSLYVLPTYPPTWLTLFVLFFLADLWCLLRLCLCLELSLLHWLMIGLQYSCPMSPPFHGQVAKWQQVWCFFCIKPWVDLLPFNNQHCSPREVAVSLLLSAENIYVGIKPQEFWSSKQIYRTDVTIGKPKLCCLVVFKSLKCGKTIY